jgi:DNA polymerase-3 subunit epsilon
MGAIWRKSMAEQQCNHWQQISLLPPVAPVLERILIIDTETTGLDPEQHHCLEVGAILYGIPQRTVLSQLSFLLPVGSNPAQPLNGIDAIATQQPQPWAVGLQLLIALAADAQVALAHNAAFDRQWFGRKPLPKLDLPWLCSMDDISWPAERQLRTRPSVRDLALAYGVPVWEVHRALTDCTYLAQVFSRCNNLEQLLADAMEPRLLYRAQVSYDDRHLARAAGFRWNEPVAGAWSRRLSERQLRELELPFTAIPVAV